jgi:Protein of unknown function (DUF1153)
METQMSVEILMNTAEASTSAAPASAAKGAGSFSARELPPPGTKRWVIRRKAEVVTAVRNGVITLEEACRRYKLSMEEFLSWQRLIEHHGVAGLRTTRLQDYRTVDKSD